MIQHLKALVIDDEPLARKRILLLLNDIQEIEAIGECKTGKEAVEAIQELLPDVVFLDIKMKDKTGFEVLKEIPEAKMPQVVFVTAYDAFALKAFDFYAVDYLLKPFSKERFLKAVDKILRTQKEQAPRTEQLNKIQEVVAYLDKLKQVSIPKMTSNKIPVRTGKKIEFIDTENIHYITASGSYVDIYTMKKNHVLRSTLQDLLSQLPANKFYRIHRSTIINMDFLIQVLQSDYGEIDVKMNDGKIFRVSKSYKKEIQHFLGI